MTEQKRYQRTVGQGKGEVYVYSDCIVINYRKKWCCVSSPRKSSGGVPSIDTGFGIGKQRERPRHVKCYVGAEKKLL